MKPQKGTKVTKIENGMQQNQVGNEGRVGIDDCRLMPRLNAFHCPSGFNGVKLMIRKFEKRIKVREATH